MKTLTIRTTIPTYTQEPSFALELKAFVILLLLTPYKLNPFNS